MAKSIRKIRLSCFKKDGFPSTSTINDVLYILEAKTNLLFLEQLSKQRVNIKIIGTKIVLSKKEKTIITGSKIGHV